MNIVTIVGARPQFIKAAPVSTAMERIGINEKIVYTGQHYDDCMSTIFFREFNMPAPSYSLGINNSSHGQMTGRMLESIESVLIDESPNFVLVYGDTNSTLAGALASAKLGIPIVHVEAGLRSYRSTMPEEINRRLTDHMSSVLFCPTETAVKNLSKEGIISRPVDVGLDDRNVNRSLKNWPVVLNVGDVMVDALYNTLHRTSEDSLHNIYDIEKYALLTIHRAESTNNKETLYYLWSSICELAEVMPVLFPIHPRTSKIFEQFDILKEVESHKNIKVVEPMDHASFVHAQKNARVVITDSGGAQKEACILGVPCLTLREETEWIETTDSGWNELLGCPPKNLAKKAEEVNRPEISSTSIFGDGHSAERIANYLLKLGNSGVYEI